MQLIFNVIESCHNKSRLWCEPHRMPFRPWHWRLGVFFRCCVPDEDADRFWASEMVKLLLGWDFLTGTFSPLTVTFTGHKFPFMALKSTTSPHLSIGTLVNSLIFSTWVFLPDWSLRVLIVSYWIYFTLVKSIPALLHLNSVLVWPLSSKSTRSYRLLTYSGHPDNRTVQPHACWRVDVKDKGSWGWMWHCPFSDRSIFLPWCQKELRR